MYGIAKRSWFQHPRRHHCQRLLEACHPEKNKYLLKIDIITKWILMKLGSKLSMERKVPVHPERRHWGHYHRHHP